MTLRGENWQPGESVHIYVNDDWGSSWSRHVDVIADADGRITDQFNLPSWFVAEYRVVATGGLSGTATTTFTDGAVRVRTDGTGGTAATITWALYGSSNCTGTALAVGSIVATTTNNGTDVPSATASGQSMLLTAQPLSGYAFSSWANGTFVNASANPGCLSHATSTQNTRAIYTTATTVATSTSLSSGTNPSTYGTSVTFTATVTGSTNPSGVGSVTFKAGATTLCSAVALTGNSAECATSALSAAASPHSITAEYSGATGFAASTSTALSQVVDRKNLTISGAVANNKAYDGNTTATVSFGSASLVGVVGSDSVSINSSAYGATFATSSVGTSKPVTVTGVTLAGTAAGNYTLSQPTGLTANIAAATVTGSFTADDKVYDGTDAATILTRSITSGIVGSEDVTLTGGTATFSDKHVGTGKTVTGSGFTLGGADAANYVLGTVDPATADITPLAISGTFTADDKVYDGTTDATVLTRDLVGEIAGDDVTLDGGTATFDTKDAGTGKTVTLSGATLVGADAGNYTLTSVATTTADIAAATVTGSFTADDKVYDGTDAATILTRSITSGIVGSEDVTLTGGTATFSDKHVGTGKTVTGSGFTLGGADAANYVLGTVDPATADITPRDLTVTATGIDKVYDGTTAATVTLGDDRVSGDVFTAAYTGASFDTKHVGTDKAVSVAGISISGTDAGNYTLVNTTAATTADITVRPITVTAATDMKVYDGDTSSDGVPTITTGSLGVGDTVTWSQAFDTKHVGTAKTLTPAGTVNDGNGGANYDITFVAVTTGDITPLAISGTFTADDKVYDGTTSATVLTGTLSGTVPGDVVSLQGGTATFDTKDVGTGKTVTLSGATLAGADAGNYSLTSVATTTADITPRDLTVTATGIDKVYDGTTAATVTLGDDRVSGDVFTAAYTGASFDTKHVGTDKAVSVAGISISGTDAGNYTLVNTTAATTADITSLTVYGSFTAADKVWDGNTAATITGTSLTGVLTDDVVTLVGGTATFDSPAVGSGKTVTGTGFAIGGANASDYQLASTTLVTTASITAWTAAGTGFYAPVGIANSVFTPAGTTPNPPSATATTVWNTIRGGQTVPLKFNVFAGSVEKTNLSDISSFTQTRLTSCAASAGGEDPIELVTTGGTSLRYVTPQWVQNWQTPRVNSETCYRATVTFADGSALTAFFKVRK